jgi:ribosomal protein S27E
MGTKKTHNKNKKSLCHDFVIKTCSQRKDTCDKNTQQKESSFFVTICAKNETQQQIHVLFFSHAQQQIHVPFLPRFLQKETGGNKKIDKHICFFVKTTEKKTQKGAVYVYHTGCPKKALSSSITKTNKNNAPRDR